MSSRGIRRSPLVALALALTFVLPGAATASKPQWRKETRIYAGTGYTNIGLALPGALVDCQIGVTCVEVFLEPRETKAHFEVADLSGQSVSGWALGWSPDTEWRILQEFCGSSDAPVNVTGQQRLVIVFAVGQRCLPDGVAPTAGEVHFRIR